MPVASRALVEVLRETADRIAAGADYRWSHFGRCNCGHLVQTITRVSPAEIHEACTRELAEWSEIPEDYCAGTGLKLEYLLDRLRELGLDRDDMRHIEDLSDPAVLRALPGGHRWLQRHERADVVAYFCTLADMLEARLPLPAAPAEGETAEFVASRSQRLATAISEDARAGAAGVAPAGVALV